MANTIALAVYRLHGTWARTYILAQLDKMSRKGCCCFAVSALAAAAVVVIVIVGPTSALCIFFVCGGYE